MGNNNEYIKTLDFLISETHVAAYRAALVAARNRLDKDDREHSAELRTPEDWPYCEKCGKAYKGAPTTDMYIRHIAPACDCHAASIWNGRPADDVWEYLIDPETMPDAQAHWARFGATMGWES